jgi:hypothetical protein
VTEILFLHARPAPPPPEAPPPRFRPPPPPPPIATAQTDVTLGGQTHEYDPTVINSVCPGRVCVNVNPDGRVKPLIIIISYLDQLILQILLA